MPIRSREGDDHVRWMSREYPVGIILSHLDIKEQVDPLTHIHFDLPTSVP